MATPSLSIIIPLYKAEHHLPGLFSMLEREGVIGHAPVVTAEVIMVDDGSPDGTAALATTLAGGYSNVRLITQPNSGQGCARNRGLAEARMDYIYMMDQDDMLAPCTLIPHLRLLHAHGAEAVRFGFDTPDPGAVTALMSDSGGCPGVPEVASILTGKEYIVVTDGLHNATPVWIYIFSRRLLERSRALFDPELRFYEDMLFTWRLLKEAHSIITTTHTGYHWVQYPDSDMHEASRAHRVRRRLTLPRLVGGLRALMMPEATSDTDREINALLLRQAEWYEFAYWSMVLSLRALPRREALRELERHRRLGFYPLTTPYPRMPHLYPASAAIKLRRMLLNRPELLKFAIHILL